MGDNIAINIIDNGTSSVRAGFPSNKGPHSVNINVLGRCLDADADPTQYFVGDNLLSKGSNYSREYPMQKGVIVHWELMEKMWNKTLIEDMRVFPDETFLIVTDSTFSPKTQREKMAEIFFETFGSPGLRIIDDAVSGLNFLWKNTGLTISMGYESIRVVPVYNGHALSHHGVELNYGGNDLTNYMAQKLVTATDLPTIEDILKKSCYVAEDFEKALSDAKTAPYSIETKYESPDGADLIIGIERFKCSEILFDPSIVGKEDQGLHKAIHEVIMKVDPEIRDEITKEILVCGYPASIKGISNRLNNEMSILMPGSELNCRAPPGCNLGSYYGASYLPESDGGKFMSSFMSKEQYDEDGIKIVRRMCY